MQYCWREDQKATCPNPQLLGRPAAYELIGSLGCLYCDVLVQSNWGQTQPPGEGYLDNLGTPTQAGWPRSGQLFDRASGGKSKRSLGILL